MIVHDCPRLSIIGQYWPWLGSPSFCRFAAGLPPLPPSRTAELRSDAEHGTPWPRYTSGADGPQVVLRDTPAGKGPILTFRTEKFPHGARCDFWEEVGWR